jgi:hypothetical protein
MTSNHHRYHHHGPQHTSARHQVLQELDNLYKQHTRHLSVPMTLAEINAFFADHAPPPTSAPGDASPTQHKVREP